MVWVDEVLAKIGEGMLGLKSGKCSRISFRSAVQNISAFSCTTIELLKMLCSLYEHFLGQFHAYPHYGSVLWWYCGDPFWSTWLYEFRVLKCVVDNFWLTGPKVISAYQYILEKDRTEIGLKRMRRNCFLVNKDVTYCYQNKRFPVCLTLKAHFLGHLCSCVVAYQENIPAPLFLIITAFYNACRRYIHWNY